MNWGHINKLKQIERKQHSNGNIMVENKSKQYVMEVFVFFLNDRDLLSSGC